VIGMHVLIEHDAGTSSQKSAPSYILYIFYLESVYNDL